MAVEAAELLKAKPGDVFLDATCGMGGHSEVLAKDLSPGGVLIGLDRDAEAIQIARKRLSKFEPGVKVILKHTEFSRAAEVLSELGNGKPLELNAAMIDAGARV